MNRLIVKPMPHSMATPQTWSQVAPRSGAARPKRTVSQTAPKMPSCLPRNRPAAIPSGSGASSRSSPTPASDTPALAKPNKRHDQEGDPGREPVLEPVERRIRRVRRARAWLTIGIAAAASTPATVACTPDSSTAYQSRPAPIR